MANLPYTWTAAGYTYYEERDEARIGLPVASLTCTIPTGDYMKWKITVENDPLDWNFPLFNTKTAAEYFILSWYSELKVHRADQLDATG